MTTIENIFENSEWLTSQEVSRLQKNPSWLTSSLLSDWERCGRVFSVSYQGDNYYARYQFDPLYQPLPIIKEILDAYGSYEDTWAVAAWFYFPNGWLVNEQFESTVPLSPKDALHLRSEVINAARNRRGTYIG